MKPTKKLTNLHLNHWKALALRIIVQMMINHEAIGGVMKEIAEEIDVGTDLEVLTGVIGMTGTPTRGIMAVIEAAAIAAVIGIDIEAGIEIGIETGTVTVTDRGRNQEIGHGTDQEIDTGAEKTKEVIAGVTKARKTKLQMSRNLIEEIGVRKKRTHNCDSLIEDLLQLVILQAPVNNLQLHFTIHEHINISF